MLNAPVEWKKKVAASFSKASQGYEEVAYVQGKAANLLAKELTDYVGGLASVLEWGSGTGFLTKRIAQEFKGVSITAVDLSFSMLNELEKNLSAKESKQIFPCVGDMDTFENNKKYSLVCSSFALQWSVNPLLLLSNSARFLESEGFLAHALPIKGSLRSLYSTGYLNPIPQLSLSMDDLVQSLKSFDVLLTKTVEIRQEFAHPLAALRHIKAFGGLNGPPLQKSLLSIRKNHQPVVCEWCIGCLIARKKR